MSRRRLFPFWWDVLVGRPGSPPPAWGGVPSPTDQPSQSPLRRVSGAPSQGPPVGLGGRPKLPLPFAHVSVRGYSDPGTGSLPWGFAQPRRAAQQLVATATGSNPEVIRCSGVAVTYPPRMVLLGPYRIVASRDTTSGVVVPLGFVGRACHIARLHAPKRLTPRHSPVLLVPHVAVRVVRSASEVVRSRAHFSRAPFACVAIPLARSHPTACLRLAVFVHEDSLRHLGALRFRAPAPLVCTATDHVVVARAASFCQGGRFRRRSARWTVLRRSASAANYVSQPHSSPTTLGHRPLARVGPRQALRHRLPGPDTRITLSASCANYVLPPLAPLGYSALRPTTDAPDRRRRRSLVRLYLRLACR